ncbi:P-loop containing nucleoside triphosphate hydrolase protein [Circinella umbellata]|nr:P-loop containing nucleoside triphosphate hydrolase protein [Circinella umbellata]
MFNPMQSAFYFSLHNNDKYYIAPTGAGKTAVIEMAILRALMDSKGNNIKIIYMAPTKSLCSERTKDWDKKFKSLDISCKEFTGDTDYTTLDSIKTSDIIVTTPEKWDSMTRRWTDYKEIMKYITLFVMDEVHILNEKRGAVLEACVSRMKTMEHTVRYVAVSATVPNIQDIADWLGATAISFSEDFRPVQLERVVYGIPFYGDSMFSFESKMDWKLLDMINKHSKGRPVLIFCSTRKSAQSSCEVLLKLMNQKNIQSLGHEIVDTSKIKDKKLADYLMKGVGFHHAGLETSDRQLVEQLFIQRKIRIVSTTSTLALGVNLPAHLVIIKSTKTYQNGALVDYSDIELLQMIGRAGRPGLEDSGCAVILTTPDMEQRYKTIMCGSNSIESCLHGNLVEHMMTEICLGTVIDIETCIKWLQSTFLYIRIKKNPSRYIIEQDGSFDSQSLTPSQVLKDICKKNIKMLTENDLVTTMDTNHGTFILKPTAYGIAMDRYCIKLETMITILKTETCSSIKDVLNLVSRAKEFEAMRFTVGEKPFLNALQNNVNIRFPISCKVATIADKIFLVIQCVLGDISLHTSTMGASLALASFQILLYASRIAKCIIDCSVYDQDAIRLTYTLELYRCIQAKMWTTSSYPLRQIEKIGPKYAKMLAKAGIKTLDQLRLTEASRIEVILHRNPPFGNQVK